MSRRLLVVLLGVLFALGGATTCGGGTTSLPPYLCQACNSDADCGGGGNRCLDLSQGGVACGVDCSGTSCPGGFLCATIAGGGANCIPAAGVCPSPGGCPPCAAGTVCDSGSGACVPLLDGGIPPGDAAGQHDVIAPQQDAAPSLGITVIVEPGDNGAGLLNAITGASSSVHMIMYMLTDPDVIDALLAAHRAGRDVKVLLNQTFPAGQGNTNGDAFNQLQAAGVAVRWAPSTFTLTHAKTVIIDGTSAWIMTMNATKSAPTSNREYLAVDTDADDVAEAEAIFQADWNGTAITPQGKLVVAPVNARERLTGLIASATATLDMEAETLSDYTIESALIDAHGRGVAVKIVLSDEDPSAAQADTVARLKAAGIPLRTRAHPMIHAKAIVADGARCYVGSENFTLSSLVYNREIGVIFATSSEVQKVLSTIRADFAAGTPL
jgi:cardiolipin synthase